MSGLDRKPPTDFLDHRESARRARVALGGEVRVMRMVVLRVERIASLLRRE